MNEHQPRPILVGAPHAPDAAFLGSMLGRHPQIAWVGETNFLEGTHFPSFHRFLGATWEHVFRAYGRSSEAVDQAAGAFIDSLFSEYCLKGGKQRWADSSPPNRLHLDYLFRLFPHAQFIDVVRDPRGIAARAAASPEAVGEIAQQWVDSLDCTAPWDADGTRYRRIRYEDMVRDRASTLEDMFMWLRLPWHDDVLETLRIQGGAWAQDRGGSTGIWPSALSPDAIARVEAVAITWMRRLGYELVSSGSKVAAVLEINGQSHG